jgi:hypothetical protein
VSEEDQKHQISKENYRIVFNKMLLRKFQDRYDSVQLMTPGIILKKINDSNLTSRYLEFVRNFQLIGLNSGSVPGSWLPGQGHLHHLLFLAPPGFNEHFIKHGVFIHDPGDTAPGHGAPGRIVIAALLGNPAARAGRPLKEIDAGTHVVDPDRYILLSMIIIADEINALKGAAHHLTDVLLLQEAPSEDHLLFAGARGLHRRLVRFHPGRGLGDPTPLQASQPLVGWARHGQLLIDLHHCLHVHFAF